MLPAQSPLPAGITGSSAGGRSPPASPHTPRHFQAARPPPFALTRRPVPPCAVLLRSAPYALLRPHGRPALLPLPPWMLERRWNLLVSLVTMEDERELVRRQAEGASWTPQDLDVLMEAGTLVHLSGDAR